MGFDDIIPHVGGFGRYQKRVLFLLCLPVVNLFFYIMYREIFLFNPPTYNQHKFVSLVARLQLTGNLLGSLIFGLLSDVLGRKPSLFAAILLQLVTVPLGAVLTGAGIGYLISEVLIHASLLGINTVAFVMAIEMVGPARRAYSGIILISSSPLSFMPLLSVVNSKWTWMLYAFFSSTSLLFLSYYWIIPESTRWLQAKGRQQRAIENSQKTARANRVDIVEETLHELYSVKQDSQLEQKIKESSLSWVQRQSSNLICRTLIIIFVCCVNSACVWCLQSKIDMLYSVDLKNILVFSAIEIPLIFVMMFMLTRWSRRPILCGSMLLAGASVLLNLLPVHIKLLSITIDAIGYLVVLISYLSFQIFVAEQLPTVFRTVGLGAFCLVDSIIIILDIELFWNHDFYSVYGALMIIAALLTLLLPETLNKPLPDTIKDAKNIGRKQHTYGNIVQNSII